MCFGIHDSDLGYNPTLGPYMEEYLVFIMYHPHSCRSIPSITTALGGPTKIIHDLGFKCCAKLQPCAAHFDITAHS